MGFPFHKPNVRFVFVLTEKTETEYYPPDPVSVRLSRGLLKSEKMETGCLHSRPSSITFNP